MSDVIKKIKTKDGDKQIDYDALANLPVSDVTLTQEGSFADAKIVGEKINKLLSENLERKNEISVERARINALNALEEGSTTGDAELMDGRTDYKGNTHVNIGEHIRKVTSQLSEEISNLPTGGSGLNNTAKNLLITILRNGVYSTDQSANITALETALSSGADIPDTPVEPEQPEIGIVQTGSILAITSGVTATQTGSLLAIA